MSLIVFYKNMFHLFDLYIPPVLNMFKVHLVTVNFIIIANRFVFLYVATNLYRFNVRQLPMAVNAHLVETELKSGFGGYHRLMAITPN